MTINDLRKNRILPFEIEDEKLHKLFSFFLHSAPLIESERSVNLSIERVNRSWNTYITSKWKESRYKIYSSSTQFPDERTLDEKYSLAGNSIISRKSRSFVCKRHDEKPQESDVKCVLRHLRNSIAHCNVFVNNAGNRKYILFEDYNRNKNITAILLFSQSDLSSLKSQIMK